MNVITIPLREFAVPVPLTGSIEANSGYGRSAAEGQEIHLRVQRKRARADSSYQAEVAIGSCFDREGYCFRIDGRMDGIFRRSPPVIEEIKSSFSPAELRQRLEVDPMEHPYSLQLLTYGYFYWREYHVLPSLTLHLVSSRTAESTDLHIPLEIPSYESWLELRLDQLVQEARLSEKRVARRRKAARNFIFPFENARPGQVGLMQTIEEGMKEGNRMLIQAPTGLGKTAGVLYPVLKEALSRGQKVVYVTPKNSQHSVAEDAVIRFQEGGTHVKYLAITAKSKICLKEEPLCNPEYCEYALDYYGKFHRHDIGRLLAKKRRLKAGTFRKLGEEYAVCPYELQFESAEEADVVICDYNYVFAPRSPLGRTRNFGVDRTGKPNLVVDEAHNVPARAMDYYSSMLSSVVLAKMRDELRETAARFRHEAEELLEGCIGVVASCRTRHGAKAEKIEPPAERFLDQESKLRGFLSRYLDSAVEIRRRDPILRLCFYWAEFTEKLTYVIDPGRDEFFTTFHPDPAGGMVKITCCDASAMLKDCYTDYEQIVAFSATLKPFEYYAKLSGLQGEKLREMEFRTPFPKDLRKLLVIPQISTRYAQRERNYGKIADAVGRIAELRRGNYFVFLPSFEFLEKVAGLFQPPAGFMMLRQERGMKSSAVEAVLDHLREGNVPTIVFAVQGGSFSEGVDYAGEMLIGAFIVGPPLPNADLEREQMRKYYQRQYGAGFEYAFTIPAMAKAVQAAGRVIRSESDRGLIVLMDNRFTERDYSSAMPVDWFESDVTELVSDSILGEIAAFWARQA